jgi:hypothetical protein
VGRKQIKKPPEEEGFIILTNLERKFLGDPPLSNVADTQR